MIKRIPFSMLKPGMFLHDLNCSWQPEPICSFRYKITDDQQLETLHDLGAHEVYIDTALGNDVPGAQSEMEVRQTLEAEMIHLAEYSEIPLQDRVFSQQELNAALDIHNRATKLIQNMMMDVRLGHQIEFDAVTETLQHLNHDLMGSFSTLIQLSHLRNKDSYTFQHSVSVCAFLTAFCKMLEFNRDLTAEVSTGALLHDIGKMRVPLAILNKPGRLTKMEFDEIKQHVVHGQEILTDSIWIDTTALQVLNHHHERYDGTGYPLGLKGTEISPVGQMAAIVDVYDAITAERAYHQPLLPVEALRKLREWSRFHFNEELVTHFIRSLGIYPVRTVVCLESGRVGIVIEQNPTNLARPILLVVYDEKRGCTVSPQKLNLEQTAYDRILSYADPTTYNIDVERYLSMSLLH